MITKRYLIPIFIFLFVFGAFDSKVYSQTASEEEIKAKIEERNTQIKKLEEEIRVYNAEVLNANKEATSLQGALRTLDLTKKKISTDITLTQTQINKAELTIGQLDTEINKAEDQIDVNKEAIIDALRNTQAMEDLSIIQLILARKDIGEIWNDIHQIKQTQEVVRDKSKELVNLKDQMETRLQSLSGQKKNLLTLKQDLSGKKQAVELTEKEKAVILAQTKNKEATYKALVRTKEEQKEQFEKELFEYEAQLNYAIDKGSYPKPRNGILSWPLASVYVTQRFGKTVGAEKLYVSGSHNGIDFRAPVGTKIINVLDGTVVGSGNTDLYPGCYSFGKWVMVRHDNGLSTIYAHLSSISVSNGQRLKTGDTIGFSGNTGYSTGPHLHISVYATQGVRIERYANSIGCKQAVIPLADIKAYLDPLQYFPSL